MSGFTDYLEDVFVEFGRIHCRKMFGGHGVYHDGIMFGLVADDILYLKADAENSEYFQQRGLEPFAYTKGKKVIKMSYYQAPEEMYDDPREAVLWARRSYACALRAQAGKKR